MMSILCLDGQQRDIADGDLADRGANAKAAASALLAPTSARK